jgi:hypothetical protein
MGDPKHGAIIGKASEFQSNTPDSWHEYFLTGAPKYFFALMQTLLSGNENYTSLP